MDISGVDLQLEEIGLNRSEIKVYLSLLRLGASSTGPIVTESKTAYSKVYVVLEKLIERGLVSYFTKDNVRWYKAASPKMIIQFLEEKEREIEVQKTRIARILPSLVQLEKEREEEKEALIFTGPRGIKTAFANLVDEMKSGEEVHIMGVYDFGERFLHLAIYFQKLRSNKGIKAKFLINRKAEKIAEEFSKYPPVQIKFMPENMLTPAIFLIYGDKVIINLAKEMTFFVLKSKSAKDAFEAYFQLLWGTAAT